MIDVGTEAPDFELPSSETNPEGKPGKKIKLSDFRGKKNVVLAFYPLDFSPTCSKEHASDAISALSRSRLVRGSALRGSIRSNTGA